MSLQWRNQIWQSLEDGARMRWSECGLAVAWPFGCGVLHMSAAAMRQVRLICARNGCRLIAWGQDVGGVCSSSVPFFPSR